MASREPYATISLASPDDGKFKFLSLKIYSMQRLLFSLTGAIIIFKLDLKLNMQNVHLKYGVV